METDNFYLAEFNISRLKAPLDSPIMQEFVDFLDPVNRFAENSPGFIWRLTAPGGLAASYLPPAFEDEMIVTNLTLWRDIPSLRNFVYQTVHTAYIPTLDDAKQKLEDLEEHGPTPAAFTLHSSFDPSGTPLKNLEH
jgi:hypothetical protein